jgi:hypothetical protein
MHKLVRPASFIGGLLCGILLSVLVIGRISIQARQAPEIAGQPVLAIATSVEPVQDPPQSLPPSKPDPAVEEPPSIPSPAPTPNQQLDPQSPAPAAEPEADPEALAGQYVEKARQDARNAVEKLTKEAETLKARLQKVDAALVRWRGLLTALDAPGGGPPQGAADLPEPGLSGRAAEPGSALPEIGPDDSSRPFPPPVGSKAKP